MLRCGTKKQWFCRLVPSDHLCRIESLCAETYGSIPPGLRDGDMQIRSKAYLQFISVCRSLRDLMPPNDGDAPTGTSPSLLYAAVVLTLLLMILEIDLHRGQPGPTSLAKNTFAVESTLMSP
jgi:hypothetical protein